MSKRFTYAVQVHCPENVAPLEPWVTISGVAAETRDFCLGFATGHRENWPPHRKMRVLRSDGKVIEFWPENNELSVGMVAGFPTPEQYEEAAKEALRRASQIRQTMGTMRRGSLESPSSAASAIARRRDGEHAKLCRFCEHDRWVDATERLCRKCFSLFNQGVGVGRACEIQSPTSEE